jgi:hypothetical protein
MAVERRDQVKRILLVVFVLICIGLIVLNWAGTIGEAGAAPPHALGPR